MIINTGAIMNYVSIAIDACMGLNRCHCTVVMLSHAVLLSVSGEPGQSPDAPDGGPGDLGGGECPHPSRLQGHPQGLRVERTSDMRMLDVMATVMYLQMLFSHIFTLAATWQPCDITTERVNYF